MKRSTSSMVYRMSYYSRWKTQVIGIINNNSSRHQHLHKHQQRQQNDVVVTRYDCHHISQHSMHYMSINNNDNNQQYDRCTYSNKFGKCDTRYHYYGSNRHMTSSTSTSTPSSSNINTTGLFSIPELQKPNDFDILAQQAMKDGNRIRNEVTILYHSLLDNKENNNDILIKQCKVLLRLLDGISQVVCNVIDVAELCRNVHTNDIWREHANDTFTILSNYIVQLNSDKTLYNAVLFVYNTFQQNNNHNHTNNNNNIIITEEEIRFSQLLKDEFERDGIHVTDHNIRHSLQSIQHQITSLESSFYYNLLNSNHIFTITNNDQNNNMIQSIENVIPRSILKTLPSVQYNDTYNTIRLNNNDNQVLQTLLKYSSNATLRKDVYMEFMTSIKENLVVLNELRLLRNELGIIQGYESYVHRTLQDKMIGTLPIYVINFLKTIQNQNNKQYNIDMNTLKQMKYHMENNTNEPIQPWDISYYGNIVKTQLISNNNELSTSNIDLQTELTEYFTLNNTIQCLQILVQELFGIIMIEEINLNHIEQWDINNNNKTTTIRKYQLVHHDTNTILGTIYFDFYQRLNKYNHAAHFTVRCGCQNNQNVLQDEIVLRHDNNNNKILYQEPIVALVCNLSSATGNNHTVQPLLLSHSEIETIFHEFGHALHSLLSRTTFQHVAGTRTCIDFVETPSHLFEQYVWDYTFLKYYLCKHYITNETLSDNNIQQLISSRYTLQSLERQNQILYSLFDQQLFGKIDNNITKHSSQEQQITSMIQMYGQLHTTLNIPYADGTHWFTRFGHLISYGASYYSYLYSQRFANEIWDKCFMKEQKQQNNSSHDNDNKYPNNCILDRNTGEQIWKKMLIHGGSKDPKDMLRDLLGEDTTVIDK